MKWITLNITRRMYHFFQHLRQKSNEWWHFFWNHTTEAKAWANRANKSIQNYYSIISFSTTDLLFDFTSNVFTFVLIVYLVSIHEIKAHLKLYWPVLIKMDRMHHINPPFISRKASKIPLKIIINFICNENIECSWVFFQFLVFHWSKKKVL